MMDKEQDCLLCDEYHFEDSDVCYKCKQFLYGVKDYKEGQPFPKFVDEWLFLARLKRFGIRACLDLFEYEDDEFLKLYTDAVNKKESLNTS